ncbi:MAG: hypothetical protein WCC93_12485, partial [Chthoniobacterales bacterium]
MVGAVAPAHGTDVIDAGSATVFCTGTFTLYSSGAIAFFDNPVAFFRGGVSLFGRSVVFFNKLHHSADKRYVGACGRRPLR